MLNKLFSKKLNVSGLLDDLKSLSDNQEIYFKEFKSPLVDTKLPSVIELRLKYKGQSYSSWGHAENTEKAAFKATMELVERIAAQPSSQTSFMRLSDSKTFNLDEIASLYPKFQKKLPKSSSGVALHTDKAKAINGALEELTERHIILKALVLEVSPHKIFQPKIVNKFQIPKEFTFDFFYWSGPFGLKVALSRFKTSKGQYFGLGSSKDIEKALEKSFFESSGRIYRALNLSNLNHIDHKITNDNIHMQYHENNLNSDLENLLMKGNYDSVIDDKRISKKDIFFYEYNLPKELGKYKKTIRVARVISPLMQNLFLGDWKMEKLNPMAFEKSPEKLPNYLHIIG